MRLNYAKPPFCFFALHLHLTRVEPKWAENSVFWAEACWYLSSTGLWCCSDALIGSKLCKQWRQKDRRQRRHVYGEGAIHQHWKTPLFSAHGFCQLSPDAAGQSEQSGLVWEGTLKTQYGLFSLSKHSGAAARSRRSGTCLCTLVLCFVALCFTS